MTSKTAPARYTSSDLERLIAARYPTNEYATFFDVANATGSGVDRRADALTINLWPSRGLELEGFEIKVDRRDWLRELKAPEKADVIFRFCHRWWIVAPEGVVADGELPKTWGLLSPVGNKLKAIKNAPKLTPIAPTLTFFASLCRSAQQQLSDNGKIEAATINARREGHDGGYRAGKRDAEYIAKTTIEQLKRELQSVRDRIEIFEKSSGVNIETYRHADPAKLGEAVRFVLNGELERYAQQVRAIRGQFATGTTYLDRMCDAVAEILEPGSSANPLGAEGGES